MSSQDDRRCLVLVSLQQALLGEVASNLRAVTVGYDDISMSVEAFYDGEVGDDECEAMSLVETELIAMFPDHHVVNVKLVRKDFPDLIPKDCAWVYYRKEPLY